MCKNIINTFANKMEKEVKRKLKFQFTFPCVKHLRHSFKVVYCPTKVSPGTRQAFSPDKNPNFNYSDLFSFPNAISNLHKIINIYAF